MIEPQNSEGTISREKLLSDETFLHLFAIEDEIQQTKEKQRLTELADKAKCKTQFNELYRKWKKEYEELPKEGLNNICLRRAVQTGYPERWALYYRANIEQYPRFLSIALRGNELPLTLNEGMMSAITERIT